MPGPISVESQLLAAQEARKKGTTAPISLPGAELAGAQLASTDLGGANLSGADLTGAMLAGANLARANLRNAILVGASLDGADLTDADLRGADLAGARIDDAVFGSTRLEGACMQAVFGDPLSMAGARMDKLTIIRSEFTLRDVAQFVVRGVEVQEDEVVPFSGSQGIFSLAPPSILPIVDGASLLREIELPDIGSEGPFPPVQVESRLVSPQSDVPVSSKRIVETFQFDAPLRALPEAARALHSIPPMYSIPPSVPRVLASQGDVVISEEAPPPLGLRTSIIPMLRAAEISTRLKYVDDEQTHMPASQRMFLQLNALIDAARTEDAPPVSLRPQVVAVKKLAESEFQFPEPGDLFLGVTVERALPKGSTSRCFLGKNASGDKVVLRVFDPHCPGAALQLPAFQRGVRALNLVQSAPDAKLRFAEVLVVAVDQTAYVAREYPGRSLAELVEHSLTLEAGLRAISTLAEGVAEIHAQGVLVRSWKPSNVLVDGLNLVLSEPDMVHLATLGQSRGDVFGYVAYAAPEELLGRGTRSPTADVYSLGKMLEFLLTGQEPLVPLGSPPLISQRENVPPILIEIVRRATEQEPADRYQTASDFLVDLSRFQKEGDTAVLLALLRPVALSQLSVRPLSASVDRVDVQELFRERKRVRDERDNVAPPPDRFRQVEISVALLGGFCGLALMTLLLLRPTSVEKMEFYGLILAAAIGLAALALPVPETKRRQYRLATWIGLSGLIWLLDPFSLAQITWRGRVSSGMIHEKEDAVRQLARLGKRDIAGADFSGGHFQKMDLASMDLSRASLRSTDFTEAFLVEVKLQQADITGAHFEGSNLFGANLTSVVGLETASCDRYTKLPPEFSCRMGYLSNLPPPEPQPSTSESDAAPAQGSKPAGDQQTKGRRRLF